MDNFDDGFKQTNFPKSRNSSKFFTSFLAGALGASLVIGICFSVPEIKNKLVDSRKFTYISSNNFFYSK